ncbi:MAG: LysR family transcriptional regulator [Pikeienuella sp.]
MSVLNYNHLRYFWAVAHDGVLSRTAERLNLSQSALSVQIRKLEESLGHRLFERRARQLHLTEAGRIALDHADAIFATGAELTGTLRRMGTDRKVLRVGSLATLSRNFQLDFLRPVLGRADVEVVLRSGSQAELLGALERMNLDTVLVNRPAARDAVTPFLSHRVAAQQISLVGTRTRVGHGGELEALLASQPVVLPTGESGVRAGFDALVDRLGLRPRIAAEADDMAMLRLLTREGVGLGVLPPIVVKDELESGRLVEAHRLPGIAETFYAVTVARKFPNPLLAELISHPASGG